MSMRIGIRAWIDFAFKKIFGKPGNEICLISLLNSILALPKPIHSVEFLNPFTLKDFEEDKLVCVDVKATDADNRIFIVEVQIVVSASFAKRAVYYACKAYSDQLVAGQGYSKLKATYSVCLLMRQLWNNDRLHHHYRLVESESGALLEDAIEIHTVELSKYNGSKESLLGASVLEQWCYWIKYSHEHTEEELRTLLSGLEFLQATRQLTEINQVTVEKHMYDSREKASLDFESGLIDARQEGRLEGTIQGEIKLIRTLQEIGGVPLSDESDLQSQSLEQLQEVTADLRSRLRNRT
jgi:predicted transposase/invertase (TIGR01784 family)